MGIRANLPVIVLGIMGLIASGFLGYAITHYFTHGTEDDNDDT